jgi:hypothetical protein
VPNGLEFEKEEVSAQIEHVKTTYEGIKSQEKVICEASL